MNEINLVKILKDCPKGTKLYSTTYGEVEFVAINDHSSYPIITRTKNNLALTMTASGKCTYKHEDAECILFPSKDQRDWSKFKVPAKKFDYSTLKPFDKVLVRDSDSSLWGCNFLSYLDHSWAYCVSSAWIRMIPYNDETEHLVGTTDKPDEKYIWWNEN